MNDLKGEGSVRYPRVGRAEGVVGNFYTGVPPQTLEGEPPGTGGRFGQTALEGLQRMSLPRCSASEDASQQKSQARKSR